MADHKVFKASPFIWTDNIWWFRKKSQNRHAGLDPASRTYWIYWIPAFAGM